MKVKVLVTQSCLTLCNLMDCRPPGSSVHGILQAKILEWGSHSLFQGIFLTQGLNPGLLLCRHIFYHLNHQEPSSQTQLKYLFYLRNWTPPHYPMMNHSCLSTGIPWIGTQNYGDTSWCICKHHSYEYFLQYTMNLARAEFFFILLYITLGSWHRVCVCAQPCPTLCNPMQTIRLLCPWNFLDENTGVNCYFPFQGIFPTEGSNPHLLYLLHWQAGSLPLSHVGSLKKQELDTITYIGI